ncbi:MAG: methyltransferase domain-containing protein [Chloroflexi bacterium]|nr:methyltransferase domain-containing protein [Chloroflexota bacterium]MBP8056331.1 methyltransferase domain-containing protein [Chloroflexota bacterium]
MTEMTLAEFTLACPLCHQPWPRPHQSPLICPKDGITFTQGEGIWRFLLPERATYLAQFMQEYAQVRQAEGWGTPDPAYYRALPFQDISGRYPDIWHIRAQSYRSLQQHLLPPGTRPQQILDLGAGNGWLAYRLSQAGHQVAAIDLMTNNIDGLGTHQHYDTPYLPLQAEFDHLPLADAQADLAIFNGSFHYATHYEQTLREILRILRPRGRIVIMDSPVYRDAHSGQQMVQEREQAFARQHGFRGNALPNENYLTHQRLAELAAALSIQWHIRKPFYGWRWAVRPWLARLRGRREPASFYLLIGTRQ